MLLSHPDRARLRTKYWMDGWMDGWLCMYVRSSPLVRGKDPRARPRPLWGADYLYTLGADASWRHGIEAGMAGMACFQKSSMHEPIESQDMYYSYHAAAVLTLPLPRQLASAYIYTYFNIIVVIIIVSRTSALSVPGH